MTSTTRTQRRYDHRLRELVCEANSVDLAVRHGVPRSTARGWLAATGMPVVTLNVAHHDAIRLRQEVIALRLRVDRLVALLRLMALLLKLSGFSFAKVRLPDGAAKLRLLQAIDRSRSHFTLRAVLRISGLSRTRYHVWSNETPRDLNDRPSCPRSSPQQLTLTEVATIRDMVTSDEYRHVPTGTLARLAQRLGKVFASPSTWRRLVRVHQWRRPRQRVHPAKPKVGIRAARANEIWHLDASLIRLLDGSRAYLHAVIDNYSRRILAWRAAESFEPEVTAQVLLEATRSMTSAAVPTALVDGGIENFNSAVDRLVQTGLLKRVLAQTEIQFSNSMIESWWRVLKHQWLYLNTLDHIATVRKLVTFYVEQHNQRLPHSAFQGQTPDEMYFGTGADVPKRLATARIEARQSRLAANRALSCQNCSEPVSISN
jgi:transposase InsO family protein